MINVLCVLKSGGDYGPEYVERLRRQVAVSLHHEAFSVCLTDVWFTPQHNGLSLQPLFYNWPGWWSKLEAFEITGPTIYLDLDTYLPQGGSLDLLANAVLGTHQPTLWMMESFRWLREVTDDPLERWASGIMAWSGDWNWLAIEFCHARDATRYAGDQRYVSAKLIERGITPARVQDYANVRSYKWHCRDGIPPGTDVVCFHGRPRPHEVGGEFWR